ncbi:MAG TPA: carcinine hydrolase/isopenicillin-N N-acyltransferase family protein [Candidatus Paceibacterota bacterium]|nr:carcinine hydrolase/isopenicillin-N N-acyltransferase family protein [Candidatus Paceibacterota bacterium]
MNKRFSLLAVVSILVLEVPCFQASGCTLWGAAGGDAGGGTIISKNRDWKPDHVQVLKVRRDGKYAYLGLYAEGNKEPGIKQGVNEKGLCVTTASASSIPKATRDAQIGKSGLMTTLLAEYASCDQILADKEKLFSNRKPSFLMISDRKQILMLEEGLEGHFAVKVVKTGTVTHSNHYLEPSLAEYNQKIGESSTTRLDRISELIQAARRPLDISSFAEMSLDRHDGANNSLWRTGTNGCTLSSWILQSPVSGPPTLRVLIVNPGKPEELESFVLDKKFWKQPPALVLSYRK